MGYGTTPRIQPSISAICRWLSSSCWKKPARESSPSARRIPAWVDFATDPVRQNGKPISLLSRGFPLAGANANCRDGLLHCRKRHHAQNRRTLYRDPSANGAENRRGTPSNQDLVDALRNTPAERRNRGRCRQASLGLAATAVPATPRLHDESSISAALRAIGISRSQRRSMQFRSSVSITRL